MAASEHIPGQMDISEQKSTYALFMALTKWGSLLNAVGILFLVLWFCTETGFLGSAIASVVLLVAGIFFLRDKPKDGSVH